MADLSNTLSSEVLRLAGNLSKRNLLRAVSLLESLASIQWHHRGFSAVKGMIEQDHPGIEAAQRILRQANPRARAAVLNNMILGCLLKGYRKRLAFYNEYGTAPPGTLMISPTLRCNLNCYGCYAGTHERRAELSFDEVDRVLEDAFDMGTNFIVVLGGEPFMVPWLLDMVEKHPGLAFQIYTNGLLLDDARIDRLARLGNAAVTLAVDGLREETDRRRGGGAFDRILKAMEALNRAGVIVGYSVMASRYNFEDIYSDAFVDTMIEHGAGYGWIPVAVPQGHACTEPELIPTPEQKQQIRGRIQELRKRKPILLMDFLNDAEITEGCGAARITIHVNANGDVEPCVLMPFAVDNVRDKPLKEIIRSDFFQGLRGIRDRHRDETQTCMWVFKPGEVLQTVQACGAKPTSEGVMARLRELAENET